METHQALSKVELARTIRDAGYKEALIEAKTQTDLVRGKVLFDRLPSGISIHSTDTIENTDGKSTSEIAAGISINILLQGDVDFAIEDQRYHLSASTTPLLFITVINANQLFTRYFHQNKRIKKLNIWVAKDWLLSRCKNSQNLKSAEKIFADKQSVFQWPCVGDLLDLATNFLTVKHSEELKHQLYAEQVAFQIFTHCYQLLGNKAKPLVHPITEPQISPSKENALYEQKLEKILHEKLTLEQISRHLGASISTLQRYFKYKHQVTLKEYIRNQKLEYARRSILFEKLSIGEAAYYAGYNHVSNFVTAFKKYFSMTPSELQKQYLSCNNS